MYTMKFMIIDENRNYEAFCADSDSDYNNVPGSEFQYVEENDQGDYELLPQHDTAGALSTTIEALGKGVIYRMIDEFNNDIPYDF